MNILIIYGGKSCEHDVSVLTGCLARGYFADHTLYCVYFDRKNCSFIVPEDLSPRKHIGEYARKRVYFSGGESAIFIKKGLRLQKIAIDAAVNCCHGVNGEDGAVSGLLAMCNIPAVESGVVASGLAMDKVICKNFLYGVGFPVIFGKCVSKEQFCSGEIFDVAEQVGYPLIVKPATLGSSIGVSVAHDKEQFETAAKEAFSYDGRILLERALTNFYELNCAAMESGGKVFPSAVERPYTAHDVLTFSDKYSSGGKGFGKTVENDEFTEEVQRLTTEIYRAGNFSGVIRVDFLVDVTENKLYVNEINAVPGSLAYNLWKDKFTPRQFGNALIESALSRRRSEDNLVRTFSSNVLCGGKMK